MLEALQIDAMAAGGHGLHGDAVAPRHIVEVVEPLLQIPAPIAQRIDAVERFRTQRRYVQQLLEKALIVAARPAPHDGLHLDVLSGQGFEAQARQGRRLGS